MSDAAYPKRERFFAHRFVRLLAKTCAAQDIGPDGCWLLAVIAHLEDSKRYSASVSFYNAQLMAVMGFTREHTLIAARTRAVKAGWLHYEQGAKRQPGRYWVTIPEQCDRVPDGSCDESVRGLTEENVSATKETAGSSTDENVSESVGMASAKEQGKRQPFLPNPNPEPKRESAQVDPRLLELIDQWNDAALAIHAPTVHRDPPPTNLRTIWKRLDKDRELREAFEDIPAIVAAVRRAAFCHGRGWFTLPFLFTKDRETKVLRVRKLLNGEYADNGARKQNVSDDRFSYDPEQPCKPI